MKVVAVLVILLVGTFAAWALIQSKPEVETQEPVRLAPLVRVETVALEDVRLDVDAQGTVLPRTETRLVAQVAGEVVATSPSFETGGFFRKGEVLVRLDPRDYRLRVEQAEARVAQAQVQLAREEAEADLAREEWASLGEGEPRPLVLRQPQMAEAKAAVAAARAELTRAELDLERTRISAPFDGRVRSKGADLGQYLAPGAPVGTVHAIDYAEVRLPVPGDELAFLDLPLAYRDGSDPDGPAVTLSARFAGERHSWRGRVVRTEGEVDPRSRMSHLIARVENPYARSGDRPPLQVGTFVEAEVVGRVVEDAAVLPRAALRSAAGEPGRVLIVDDDERLRYRDVELVRVEGERVIVGAGLAPGERVCVSPLDVVVDGMKVRVAEADGRGSDAPAATVEPPLEVGA